MVLSALVALWQGGMVAHCAESSREDMHVFKDVTAEKRFSSMVGHWEHRCAGGAPYLVIMLSSVGCVGCHAFYHNDYKNFIQRYGNIMDFYSVDYFLTKRDMVMMSFVAALPTKLQDPVRQTFFKNHKRWWNEAVKIGDAAAAILAMHRIRVTPELLAREKEVRAKIVEQHRLLSAMRQIEYLPFFIVIDRRTHDVMVCDSFDVAEKVLAGNQDALQPRNRV